MSESFASGTPYIFWAAGIAILGAVVLVSILRNRRRRSLSRAEADEGARRVYRAEERDPANRS